MGKENIRTVYIQDFKKFSDIFDYVDDDFVVISTIGTSSNNYDQKIVRLGFFLIAFCIEGCIQMDINNKSYRLEVGDILFGLPNSTIGNTMVTPNHKVKFAGFSTNFIQQLFKVENIWDTAIHLHNNPIKHITEGKKEPVLKMLGDLIMLKIGEKPHPYHKEMIRYLFSALFCQLMGKLNKETVTPEKREELKGSSRQVNHIFRKFAELLSKDNGMHRSVSYYADALCYSPKHFSKVIKQASGRTPIELINQAAIEHIKYRLIHSEKSIKEIAEEFNFSNQSFFGKYVKAHLGISPAQYRNEK